MNWISHIFELKQNHSLPFSSETIIAMVRNTMHIFFVLCDSLVIRQKGKSQNGGNKTKHAKFSEKINVSYPLIHTRTCAYQGVRNVSLFFFSENLTCFVFLLPRFWGSPFCLITNELIFRCFWIEKLDTEIMLNKVCYQDCLCRKVVLILKTVP